MMVYCDLEECIHNKKGKCEKGYGNIYINSNGYVDCFEEDTYLNS